MMHITFIYDTQYKWRKFKIEQESAGKRNLRANLYVVLNSHRINYEASKFSKC